MTTCQSGRAVKSLAVVRPMPDADADACQYVLSAEFLHLSPPVIIATFVLDISVISLIEPGWTGLFTTFPMW